jgi:hypothetical protein
MERTGIVVGFAARKGNGSGANETSLVHLLASDSGNSSRSTENPARPLGAREHLGQPGCRAIEFSEPCQGKGTFGLWRRPLPLPQPSGGESGLEPPPDSPEGFSLSLPFPPRPRGRVFGDGFRDRDISPNPVLSW